MKTPLALILALAALGATSCAQLFPALQGKSFEHLRLEKLGGGSTSFICQAQAEGGGYEIRLLRTDELAVDESFVIRPKADQRAVFDTLDRALAGWELLSDDSYIPLPCAVYYRGYLGGGGMESEISGPLLDKLSPLEALVLQEYRTVVHPLVPLYAHYDYLRFERDGGGQLSFSCTPIGTAGYRFEVDRAEYQAINFSFELPAGAPVFVSLDQALNAQAQVNGYLYDALGPTGSWADINLVGPSLTSRVTNPRLHEDLLALEALVRERLPPVD